MADVEVTLNNSGESITYRGYVINSCDNSKVDDGSWSPTSATGMTVNASEANITITHNNTSTSDASSTFTWTSSKVSGCSKTLKVTAKGKTATYVWYISTNGGSSWSKSSAYSITITVNNNFSGGEFVRVAYCTKNMNDCVDSYTIRNGNNFTLSKIWELSDLNSSGNNCAVFSTNSTLTNDLKNSNEGTYHISGDIVSSLGDNFPINVYYEVGKNAWYKYEGGSLVEITKLNKNEISLPETVISEIIVFSQNNNYITDASKYSYEQTTGDLTINLSFEPRPISSSLKCMGIKISATDSEMAKLYENNSSIIMLPNVSGNIICDEKYKLPISFTFETPFRIHILNSGYETFPDIIHYIELGLIEKESFGNTSGIHEIINGSKMHYNMYRYNTNSDNTKYKYIFVDIYYHTVNISTAMLKCMYPPASSSVIVQKSYPANHTDNIDNLRIVIPHNTDTEYLGDFVFTPGK